MSSPDEILKGFNYTLTIMLVVVLILCYQVFVVMRPQILKLQKEHANMKEGYRGPAMHQGASKASQRSDQSQAGVVGLPGGDEDPLGRMMMHSERFTSGNEQPSFWGGSGDSDAITGTRSANDYSIRQMGGRGVLVNAAGEVVKTRPDWDSGPLEYKFNPNATSRADQWTACPPGQRVTKDNLTCYTPEGMSGWQPVEGFGSRRENMTQSKIDAAMENIY
jgi:hypothetical protein